MTEEAALPRMNPCPWCGAAVAASAALDLHRDFHIANGLHGPTCGLLLTRLSQRGTGLYVTPKPCDCGLAVAATNLGMRLG